MGGDDLGIAGGFYSAKQALASIAYGDPSAFDGLAPGEPAMFSKWGYVTSDWTDGRRSPPLMRLRWVLARVRWRQRWIASGGRWRRCPLPPLTPAQRSKVRWLLRQHGKPGSELVKELAADVELARLSAADTRKRLEQADHTLRSALSDSRLVIFGRRGKAATGTFKTLQHEAIPREFFLNKHHRFDVAWGWVTLGFDAPLSDRAIWRTDPAPDWGDIRVPRRDVEGLPSAAGTSKATLHPTANTPAHRPEDLPLWLTLREACAWIALRDARAASFGTMGSDRQAVVGMDVEWAWRQSEGVTVGPSPYEAQGQLAACGRRGALRARGRHGGAGDGDLIDLHQSEWADLSVAEDLSDRRLLLLLPQGLRGRTWMDVVIHRDDVLRAWPPFAVVSGDAGDKQEPAPVADMANAARRSRRNDQSAAPRSVLKPYSKEALGAWFVLRKGTWPPDHAPPSESECITAARKEFAGLPGRDEIRAIRREKVPASWLKTGPKRAAALSRT